MKRKTVPSIHFKIFCVSTMSGFASFLIISFFFTRVLSWRLVLHSAIFGPIIGNMIGFANALVGTPINRRWESLPNPFKTISQVLTNFLITLFTAALFFLIIIKLGIMSGLSSKLLLTILLISAGIGMTVTLIMTVYEHLKAEIADSYEKVREKELLEKELQVARRVQAGFLPLGNIRIEGFQVTSLFRPAKEVGGDYFDVIPMQKGTAIVIADVSGKGVPASLVMANMHATIHALVEDCSPVQMLHKINKSIKKNTDPRIFVTAFYGILNNQTGELNFVNAGHNPPLVLRKNGTVQELLPGGIILGVTPNVVFNPGIITIHPGDTLLCYTDGLTEAGQPYIEPWGEENLKQYLSTLTGQSTQQIAELIIKKVDASVQGIQQTDDIALVLIKRN